MNLLLFQASRGGRIGGRALKKGISVWYMRVMHGAPHAPQWPGISITSSGAVYRRSSASAESPRILAHNTKFLNDPYCKADTSCVSYATMTYQAT